MKNFFELLIFEEAEGTEPTGVEENANEVITFSTQSELDKWYETKAQKSLEKARGKWEEEKKTSIDEAIKQALEREKLSEKERKALEEEEVKAQFENKQRELLSRELRLDALDLLHEQNLPKELATALNYSSKEDLVKSVEEVGGVFNTLVTKGIEEGVKQRLATSSHAPTGNAPTGSMTLEKFSKLKTWEQVDFQKQHPEQFKNLLGGM